MQLNRSCNVAGGELHGPAIAAFTKCGADRWLTLYGCVFPVGFLTPDACFDRFTAASRYRTLARSPKSSHRGRRARRRCFATQGERAARRCRRCRVERPQQARLTAALREARSRRVARTVEFGNSSRPRRWPTQNRGCLARNAVASDRSAASLFHLAEQGPRWSKKRCPSSSAAGVWRLVIETLAGAWLRASRSPSGVGDLLADFDPGSPVAPTARPLSPLGRG